MKVLVVDDERISRKAVMASLQNAVSVDNIDEAEDGYTASSMVARGAYDLILMDWSMPKMSGLEAVKIIRKFNKKVRIIMVTGQIERESVLQALQAGANDYVAKPFKVEILREKINAQLTSGNNT